MRPLDKRWLGLVRAGVVVAVATGALRLAWVCDDALITLRTALNWTHGWGPGFNATEAVQAYTHPLWFLAWSALGAVSGTWVVAVIALGIGCTAAAVAVVVAQARTPAMVMAAGAALLGSNAFMEYTSSGLENPAAYLAVAAAIVAAANVASPRRAAGLGLAVAAVVLVRLDLVVLIAPVLALWVLVHRRASRVLATAAATAAVPLGVWWAWSWVTYGAVLPNTFAAKRNVEIPLGELVGRGLAYLQTSFGYDWVGAGVIVGGLVVVALWGSARARATAAGVVAYLGYVVAIGGDFMAGRFTAVAVLAMVLALVLTHAHRTAAVPAAAHDMGAGEHDNGADDNDPRAGDDALDEVAGGELRAQARLDAWVPSVVVIAGAALVVAVLFAAQRPPTVLAPPAHGRWTYVDAHGVFDAWGFQVADGHGAVAGPADKLRAVVAASASYPAGSGPLTVPSAVEVQCGGLGIAAVTSSPSVHWVDPCALTDRFLAQLPFVIPTPPPGSMTVGPQLWWQAGHFYRDLPDGYVDAIATADPGRLRDPVLATRLADLWALIRPAP